MSSRLTPIGRRPITLALLAGVMALGVSACGRRGQPEPPPDPNAVQTPAKPQRGAARGGRDAAGGADAKPAATTLATRPGATTTLSTEDDLDEEVDQSTTVSPQPTPQPASRRRRPSYQVPKEPFILDPLL